MRYSNSKTFETNICIDLPELEVGVAADVSFSVCGGYHKATRYSPEEYPEIDDVNLVAWELDDDYREDDSVELDHTAVQSAIESKLQSDDVIDKLYEHAGDVEQGWADDAAEAAYERARERELYGEDW